MRDKIIPVFLAMAVFLCACSSDAQGQVETDNAPDELQQIYLEIGYGTSYKQALALIEDSGLPFVAEEMEFGSVFIKVAFTDEDLGDEAIASNVRVYYGKDNYTGSMYLNYVQYFCHSKYVYLCLYTRDYFGHGQGVNAGLYIRDLFALADAYIEFPAGSGDTSGKFIDFPKAGTKQEQLDYLYSL